MTINDFSYRIVGITINLLMQKLSEDKEFVDYIIELNTIEQLYAKGIDSTGGSIGTYSAYTVFRKEEKNQPSDRVTLKDTGAFYRSWNVFLNAQSDLQIIATDGKTEGLIFKYGKDILGLTDENLSLVVNMAKKKIIEIVKQELKIAA